MTIRPPRFPCTLLFLVAVPLVATGCSEDLLNPGGETMITGQVRYSPVSDPKQDPVFDLGLGITYQAVNASPGPGTPLAAPLQGGGVTLGDPYPNPLVRPDQEPMKVVVTAGDVPVSGRVEIWGESRDFNFAVATLEAETIPAGSTTYQWNGRETVSDLDLPNGLYTLRVTIPAQGGDPTVLEAPVILNRSVQEVIALKTFNTFTDQAGEYRIPDVAVGTAFRGTGSTGTFLGNRVLRNRVTLFICDIDFRHQEEVVDIAPRDVVRVNLEVVSRKPLPPPDAGGTMFASPGRRAR